MAAGRFSFAFPFQFRQGYLAAKPREKVLIESRPLVTPCLFVL